MKIYFGIGYPPEPVKLAKTWLDIKISKLVAPCQKQYQVFKLLEQNKQFWEEISKSRKKLNIPEKGLNWELTRSLHFNSEYPSKELDEFLKVNIDSVLRLRRKESDRISRIFNLHPYIEHELYNLIVSNYIFTYPIDSISWGVSEYDEENDELIEDEEKIQNPGDLTIFIQERITKSQLINFIQSNWKEINKMNQKLPSPDDLKLSSKEKEIYLLRENEGFTYKEIADQIEEKYKDDLDGSINEDSVKTSYHRTSKKIKSVAFFRKRNKKLK